MLDKNYLEADGIGRGTKYYLAEIFNNQNNIKDETINNISIKLSDDEIKILEFIKKKDI